jgi:hypothetical protein
MMFCRVLSSFSVAAVLAVASAYSAQAQFGGMPGMPGAPGMGGFGAPPTAGPPPACRELMVMRDETQKNGSAIAAAQQRKVKADVVEACKLFKVFLASEAKFIRGMTENMSLCGVPPQVIKSYQDGHGKAIQIGKQVCEAAERPQPTGPSLSDALNSAPVLPDADNTKTGRGTYDTLQGNALAR